MIEIEAAMEDESSDDDAAWQDLKDLIAQMTANLEKELEERHMKRRKLAKEKKRQKEGKTGEPVNHDK